MENAFLPLVSVGIPTYNRPSGLKRTLEHITKQTYTNLEIIVSDNCSPNVEVENVVKDFIKHDYRVVYYKQKENIGPSNNFKFVREKATSKYFMWAADDDYFESINLIESLVIHCYKNILVFPNINIYSNENNITYGALNYYKSCSNSLEYLNVWSQSLAGYPIYGLFNLERLKLANIKVDFDSDLPYHGEGTLLHKIFINGEVKFVSNVFIRIDDNGFRPSVIDLMKYFNIFSKRSLVLYLKKKVKHKIRILLNVFKCSRDHFARLFYQSKIENGLRKSLIFILNKPILISFFISVHYIKIKHKFLKLCKVLVLKPLLWLEIKMDGILSKEEIQRKELELLEQQRQELIKRNLWLINLKIKTVLDIGSNIGQFAGKILTIMPDIDLFCFEPIKSCYEELKQNLESNKRVKFFNFALGNENGEQALNINEYSPSSSILQMNDLHKEAFTFTQNSAPEKIQIKKLDEIRNDLVLVKPLLVKIDVQGFEMEVIKGGLETIKQADIIIIETTFEELYEGQPLFHGLYTFLHELGFIYKGNFEQLTHPYDGKILQADSIFIRDVDK